MTMRLIVLVCLCCTSVYARSADEAGRTPWGAPDINGVWDFGSLTPLERPPGFEDKAHFTPEEAKEFVANFHAFVDDVFRVIEGENFVGQDLWLEFGKGLEPDLRTSLIVDPPNGKLPDLTEAGRAATEAGVAVRMAYAGPEALNTNERCMVGQTPPLETAPDLNYAHVFQTREHVVFLTEFINDARIVPLGPAAHLPENLRQWKGGSRAQWEGDTLVVHSRGFRQPLGMRNWGGGDMKLTERFTLTGPDTMTYEYTVDDRATFVAPWTVRITMHRTDRAIYEYACHERNYSMDAILRGARLQERLAAGEGN